MHALVVDRLVCRIGSRRRLEHRSIALSPEPFGGFLCLPARKVLMYYLLLIHSCVWLPEPEVVVPFFVLAVGI